MPPPVKMFNLNDKQRELIEDNILLFYKCFHDLREKYVFLSEEEVWDCCTEAAVKSAYDLDEKRGKYSTILYLAADRNALKLLRYYDFECRKGSKTNISLEYEYSKDQETGDKFAERYLGAKDKHTFIENDAIERLFDDSKLNKREREVMRKIVIEDMARVDIANEWGIRPQTVNKYVATAKEKIKKVLGR